jgi:hypothetical protein
MTCRIEKINTADGTAFKCVIGTENISMGLKKAATRGMYSKLKLKGPLNKRGWTNLS